LIVGNFDDINDTTIKMPVTL